MAHGIVDDGMLQTALVLERDRNCEGRKTMQEISRAIERVDDPDELVVAGSAAFLGEKRMLRVAAANRGDDVGFNWGGWTLGSTVEKVAKEQADTAVVAALAPICLDQFRQAEDATANLTELKGYLGLWHCHS